MVNKPPQFIVLGTGGQFTETVIRALIDHRFFPTAYIQSGKDKKNHQPFKGYEIEVKSNSLSSLLDSNKIQSYYCLGESIVEIVANLKVDYLLVACWPSLLPKELVTSVGRAALNLHPSLLPRYKGIDPVREQLLTNDRNFGVTLHHINEQYDSGKIARQKNLLVPENMQKRSIEVMAAEAGAKLFMECLSARNNEKKLELDIWRG